jgi:cytochrome c oxidase subunit 1
VIVVSVAIFIVNVAKSWRSGEIAGANPWAASGLEWAAASPPSPWNFHHIPIVEGRFPLWTTSDELPIATGLRTDRPEVLVTTALDAIPDSRHELPGPSHWPLVMAIAMAVTFITAVFTPWGYVIGFILAAAAFAGWGWPHGDKPEDEIKPGKLPRSEAA